MPSVGTTHHLKLGNEYLIIRPNTYQKSPAPTFGARISTGDPDYNNLSIWQHWVQKCWVGGMGAPEWVDDAMFDDAVGLDSTIHEKATLSRHLTRGTGAGWSMGGATSVQGGQFVVYKSILYCLVTKQDADSQLWKYTPATQTWTTVGMPGSLFRCNAIVAFDGKLFLGGFQHAVGQNYSRIYYSTTPGTWTTKNSPAGMEPYSVTAMRVYNSKLYVCFSNTVWRMKDDESWDGGTAFYKVNANSGSNWIAAMETHLGFLYMLSQNGHLHRTDGNNTFDIWSWDGQTAGVSLRSYDGKLFVGTYEYTDTADVGYGVLYQFTGAAVTELKRWGKQGRATSIGRMIVYGRRLFYGAAGLFGTRNGFGVACYDAVEDGHSIFAIQDAGSYPDTTGVGKDWLVDDLIVFGGKLIVYTRGHGAFMTEDSFKDVERGLAQFTTSTQGGVLTSSMYDGGTPGLEKLWRKMTVWCDLPTASTSMTFSYSVDGGVTFSAFPAVFGPSAAAGQQVFYLNNVRSTRFQYKVTLKTTDETKSPTLRGVSIAYLPQPEPNWQWSFVIPIADKWQLMDDSEEIKDTNALIAYFEGLFRSQQLVQFIDIDGASWALTGPGVLIYDMNTMHYDIEQPREADLRITLLESVETY